MKKALKLTAIVVAVIALAGCDFLVNLFTSVQGDVVNVKAAADAAQQFKGDGDLTLVGATITFTNLEDSSQTYTGTVDSDGSYIIPGVATGSYTVTAEKSGWSFLPIPKITVSGLLGTAPTLYGFPSPGDDVFTAVLVWEDTSSDLDLSSSTGATLNETRTDPNGAYWSNETVNGTGWTQKLDRDVTGALLKTAPLVESMTLEFGSAFVSTTEYFRFYVNNYTDNRTATGTVAGGDAAPFASVTFMKGTEHYGTYQLPYDSADKTVRIVEIVAQADGQGAIDFQFNSDLQRVSNGQTAYFPNIVE